MKVAQGLVGAAHFRRYLKHLPQHRVRHGRLCGPLRNAPDLLDTVRRQEHIRQRRSAAAEPSPPRSIANGGKADRPPVFAAAASSALIGGNCSRGARIVGFGTRDGATSSLAPPVRGFEARLALSKALDELPSPSWQPRVGGRVWPLWRIWPWVWPAE